MADRYITSSQYEKGIRKMKEYVDKSMPHIKIQELITIPANTVSEICNSESRAMEFDKPSNINLDYDFIVNYNNEEINCTTGEDETGKYIECFNDNTILTFYLGVSINQNIDETKMVLFIERLNTDTITDLILKQVESKKYLNNRCLKDDVAIKNSITIGSRNIANNIGLHSFSNGKWNTASGKYSHAEGFYTTASGLYAHTEGSGATASGHYSHAEGYDTEALGMGSHTEGYRTEATENYAHAEGRYTKALGECSHAEGKNTEASGEASHAEGLETIAKGLNSHVQGKYNIEDTENKYAHIVGNGTSLSDRKNAHTLDWSGNAWYQGSVYTGGTSQDDTNAKKLATEEYVNDSISSITVPTITNDLTNALKANYDVAYAHSQSAHAPSNAQKNSDITKAEIEAKLTGNITTHTHSQYLTKHQDISGLALKSELHTHTNKAILDAITSDKINSWDNKSTFSGSYKDLADKPTIPSVEGLATESYVDNKFFSEEIIFEGQSNDPLVLHDYYTHVPIADGMGFWVINKTIEINSSNNPYIIEISGSQGKDGTYGPNVSTFNSTYNMWVYDLGNNDKLQMGNIEYNGSPALAVAWDTAGSYSNLKITKRIDLMNTINNKVDKISGKGLSTNDLTNTLKANYDAAYNHSKSAHAPSNAQKNSDITKAEIEAKLTGNITTHTHSQYLTTHQSLDGYAKTADLATVATSGSYNDLTNKPTIPSIDGLATTNYVDSKVAGIVNSAPETLDTLNELATALGNDANFATTVSNQIGSKVDKVNGKGLSTNDLTNELKTNYDAAYTHSTSVHAPSNAQKNSDITKSEIEAKLTGNITTHTHSQYLTSIPSEYITEQELTSKGYITEAVLTSKGYATESQINSAVEAAATTHEEVKTTVNQILGGAYIE